MCVCGALKASHVVALYDFDPSTIDWPFAEAPLPLVAGQVINVLDDRSGQESDWCLGHSVGNPSVSGYFPKNYTVPAGEYEDMFPDGSRQRLGLGVRAWRVAGVSDQGGVSPEACGRGGASLDNHQRPHALDASDGTVTGGRLTCARDASGASWAAHAHLRSSAKTDRSILIKASIWGVWRFLVPLSDTDPSAAPKPGGMAWQTPRRMGHQLGG